MVSPNHVPKLVYPRYTICVRTAPNLVSHVVCLVLLRHLPPDDLWQCHYEEGLARILPRCEPAEANDGHVQAMPGAVLSRLSPRE